MFNSRVLNERPAHDSIAAASAADMFAQSGIAWAVSGDDTIIAYGSYGFPRMTESVNVWASPGVAPKIKTTGIRVGDTIRTWEGDITVSRVGSIAGFGYLEGSADETRWTIESVFEIIPA